MVIQEVIVKHKEIGKYKHPMSQPKTYVIVQNHVRELVNTSENASTNLKSDNKPSQHGNSRLKTKKRVSKKDTEVNERSPSSMEQGNDITQNKAPEIDHSDLEELKTVYIKCREVMKKIETKYGHLLNLETCKKRNKRKVDSEETTDECQCMVNKKIIFDEDGRQSTVEMVLDQHICHKKLKKTNDEPKLDGRNIAIEYNENEVVLPEDLQELGTILKDKDIERTYRNKVIDKIRSLKQDNANEIKFNKHVLIEKMKSSPDELLDFKGTNLGSLPGYL